MALCVGTERGLLLVSVHTILGGRVENTGRGTEPGLD